MASKNYDPRREQLVVENRTNWDPALGNLSESDKEWLSNAMHAEPEKATELDYERTHTGFIRIIKVTLPDVQRLFEEKAAAKV
jgi:hypothetical protein